MAVTASFSAATGQLTIVGDGVDNVINISRADDGTILINNGAVAIVGGPATVFNTTTILGLGLGGNDQITLNEFNGALPAAVLLGGSDNDLLIGGNGEDFLSGSSGNDTIRGANNADRIFGGSGNDVLLGDRGNDTVNGQAGNDLIIWNNGDGSDTVEGGDDNDFFQMNGANGAGDDISIDPNGDRVRVQRNNLGLVTIDIGTTENLDINGQGGDDVIVGSVGLAGLVSLDLDGGEGNDLLIGGDGVDVLRGGAGNDTLIGSKGNDVVLGEDGNDLMIWNNGDGSDFMEGGADTDTVQVNGADGAGDDISIDPNGQRVRFQRNNLSLFTLDIGTTENLDVNGGGGNDVIVGSVGLKGLISLDLDGGEGNDLLIGGDGADVLRGGAGNDTLLGGRGNDIMLGQDGSDLLIHNNGDGSDFMEGGEGNDTVQVNGADGAGDDISIDPNGNRIRLQRNNLGLFTLDIGTTETLDINGQGGNDVIVGSVGLAGLVTLDLDGGEGNDLLIGGDGADVLRGGAGNDTLLGNRGNDIVLGEEGNDLLIVNNGDGSDLLEGGAGSDTVQVNGDNGAGDDITIDPNGDRVRVQRNNLTLFTLNIGTTENLDINGQGGDDVIVGSVGLNGLINLDLDGGEGNDLLIGGDGVDVLRGGAGNDTLIGGKGNDVKLGQDGNDLLIWNNGDGSDLMEGGDDIDTVQVNGANGAGDDFRIDPNGDRVRFRRNNLGLFTLDIGTTENLDVNGGGGDDLIIASSGLANLIQLDLDGGEGNDLIIGGDGADVIRGGAGNDTLLGNRGNDIMLGQDGSDLLIWNNGDGSDFMEGGEGLDTVQVNGADGAGDSFRIDANGDRVRFRRTNLGLFTLDIGTTENLDINGGGGSDVIIGSTGLAGLISLDMDGGEGNDLLIGGDGADILRGGAGNDTLLGNRGNDVILGQDGNDLIIHNNGDGSDFVEGGEDNDTLQVNGSNASADMVMVTANGNRVQVQGTFPNQFILDVGTIETLDVNLLAGNDRFTAGTGLAGLISLDIDGGLGNDIITGGDGDDTIRGGGGNDLLRGRDGNDTLIGGTGNDFVFGENGNDLMVWNFGDGNDLVLGGADRDTFRMTFGNLDDEIDLSATGTFLRIEQVNQTPSVQTVGSTEVIDIRTGDGDDEVTVNDVSGVPDLQTIIIDGEEGDDIVNATDLQVGVSLIARGGAGNDIMFGGDGNDVMLGEEGRDIIIANDGNDFVSGGEGNDILISGNGNDVILGGAGNDVLSGGAGNDILLAGDGNDVMNGGADIDFLDGGAGQDSAINGETVINVPFAATAAAAPTQFSMAAFLRGEVTIHYDAKLHGVDTFANYNPGEDKIIVAGFDRAMMARTDESVMRQNADSFVRLVDDGEHTTIQFDADGSGNGHGFQDQWILEDFSGHDLNDIMDDILFA